MDSPVAMTWEDLRHDAEERGIILYRGLPAYVGLRSEHVTYRVAEWTGDLSGFLDIAKAAGVALAYAVVEVFRYQAALESAVNYALFGIADDAASSRMRAEMKKRTKHLEKHDGETYNVRCEWIKDGVLHQFERGAEWFDDFASATEEVKEEFAETHRGAQQEQERAELEEESAKGNAEEKRLQSLGERLARHPRYPEANSDARRRFLAKQLFPNEEAHMSIVMHADLEYWWDVEPKEREQAAKNVRKLYDSGMSMREIAGRLNVSAERVSKLLAMTEK